MDAAARRGPLMNMNERIGNMRNFFKGFTVMLALVMAAGAGCASHSNKSPAADKGSAAVENMDSARKDGGDKLLLLLIITDSVVTIGAKGGFMPSIFYAEFHRYAAAGGGIDTVIEHAPGKRPVNPRTGEAFTEDERADIYLYIMEYPGDLVYVMYTKSGEMLTDGADGYHKPVKGVSVGDTVYALANPRRLVIVADTAEFERRPLSVYDELLNRLMQIKERYGDAEDADDIIIAAEDGVREDKITPLVSVARTAGFQNISRAILRD